MKIYFCANQEASEKVKKYFDRIIGVLNQLGVLVMSNLEREDLYKFSDQDIEKLGQSGSIFEKIDGLVIEGNASPSESGYLIALALAHKKPILYILEKGHAIERHISNLVKDKGIARILKVQFYDDLNLEDKIGEFVHLIESGEGKEAPTIKFTLRITSRIERYLHWKTHNTKLSKADFVRNLIEDMIDGDEDYKKYINKGN